MRTAMTATNRWNRRYAQAFGWRSLPLRVTTLLVFLLAVTGTYVSAAPATHFSVSAPAAATAGTGFTITVTALDAADAIDTTYAGTVHFTSSDGASVLPGNGTLINRVRTFSVMLATAGTQTITATDTVTASITGTSNGIVVTSTAATHFSVSAPATATAGTGFTFTVTALTASDAIATGYTGTVHLTSSDGAATIPADATLVNGVGTFSATLATVGTQTITATDTVTASITGTSAGIAVTATPAATPLPPSFILTIAGLLALAIYARHRILPART